MASTLNTAKGVSRNGGIDWLRNQARRMANQHDLPCAVGVAAGVQIESWLQNRAVAYAPPTMVPMNLIDVKRSRGNQARREAIVPESVDRFSTAMRAGTTFPPIVLYPDQGRLVIIDGNNRHAAASRVGAAEIPGIVIAEDTPSEVIHLLTVEANARHGVTPELAWRVQQAFSLVSMGWSDHDAAEAAGLSISQLRTARQVTDADQRARAMRISGFGNLNASCKQALAGLRDEAAFYQLSRIAVDTGMTTEEIREVTRAIKGMPSEAARVSYIATVGKSRAGLRQAKKAGSNSHSRLHSPKTSLAAGIGKIMAVDPTALIRQIVTTSERDVVNHRLAELTKKIAVLTAAMATLASLDES